MATLNTSVCTGSYTGEFEVTLEKVMQRQHQVEMMTFNLPRTFKLVPTGDSDWIPGEAVGW